MDLFSCLSPFVFCSFASGSSGNCYYVGRQDEGILVDVGITAKQLKEKLLQQDLSGQNMYRLSYEPYRQLKERL